MGLRANAGSARGGLFLVEQKEKGLHGPTGRRVGAFFFFYYLFAIGKCVPFSCLFLCLFPCAFFLVPFSFSTPLCHRQMCFYNYLKKIYDFTESYWESSSSVPKRESLFFFIVFTRSYWESSRSLPSPPQHPSRHYFPHQP